MVCTHSGDKVLLVSLQCVQTLWELQQCGCSILGPAGHQSPMLLHSQAVQGHVAHLSRSRSNIRVHVTMGIMGKRTNTFHLGCMKKMRKNTHKNIMHLPYKQHYSKNSSQNTAMILFAPLCCCSIPQLNVLGVTWFMYDICNCTLTNAFHRVRGLCAWL